MKNYLTVNFLLQYSFARMQGIFINILLINMLQVYRCKKCATILFNTLIDIKKNLLLEFYFFIEYSCNDKMANSIADCYFYNGGL